MGHQTNAAALYAETSEIQSIRGLDLMAEAAPAAGERVLDLGCGPGNLSRELARRVGPSGAVVGIDPDLDRLDVARMTTSRHLNNLRFELGRAESLCSIDDSSIDLIFSNYVAHWIPDRQALLREVRRCLTPGGRAAFEFCGPLTGFVEELVTEGISSGQRLPNPFDVFPAETWRWDLEAASLDVDRCELIKVTYHYLSYEAFAAWWEGTTHGAIRMERLDPAYIAKLQRYFQGGATFTSNSIRFLARKPRA